MAIERFANSPTPSSPSTAWSTITSAINASDTTITVASATPFPTSPQFRLILGDEIVVVTGVVGATFTITRGAESTVAASHASGASVFLVLTAASLLRSPGPLSATGQLPYLDASGAPAALSPGSDGQYVRFASSLPTASALLMADLSGSSIVYGTDTTFGRGDAAGQMTLSAGASGTSLRLKNGSNAELGALYWNNDAFQFGTQGGVGAGTARDTILTSAAAVILATQGTSRWTLDAATGHLRPWATATSDLGTASEVVRSAYLGKLGTLTSNGFVKTSGGDGTLSVDTNTYLTTSAAAATYQPIGSYALTSGTLAQFAATTSLELKTLISDETGSGALVFATSPTLVTPDVGTPSAGVLTNCTGLPVGSVTGLGAGVATWLATPSSANLAAAVTGETGTGALVFGTAPGLTGPVTITEAVGSSGLTLTGATQTSSFPALNITQTWNASGTAFTAIKVNITDTASNNASLLQDWQVGGSSKINIDKTGAITAGAGYVYLNQGGSTSPGGFILGAPSGGSYVRINYNATTAVRGVFIAGNIATLGFAAASADQAIDVFVNRAAAATLQLGRDVNGAPVNQTFKAHNGITGTDVSSASLTIASGVGTGAGAVSSLIFQTPTVLASGTTAQSLSTRITIDSSGLTLADTMDVLISATTGSKIGQSGSKLAFYGSTPIVRAVLATGASATVDNVITALQNLGLVKQS